MNKQLSAQMSNVVQLCPYSNIQMSKEVKCVRHTNDHTNESLPFKQKPLQTLNEIIFFEFLRFFHLEEEKNEPLRSDCDGSSKKIANYFRLTTLTSNFWDVNIFWSRQKLSLSRKSQNLEELNFYKKMCNDSKRSQARRSTQLLFYLTESINCRTYRLAWKPIETNESLKCTPSTGLN